eukprot:5173756-Amphidinium_carterae.2
MVKWPLSTAVRTGSRWMMRLLPACSFVEHHLRQTSASWARHQQTGVWSSSSGSKCLAVPPFRQT